MDELRYGLLGPVKVVDSAGEAVPLTPQQRAILAMLLARRGRAVTAGDLVDGVWGRPAPKRAVSILQSQIFELRRRLEPGRRPRTPATVLASAPGGYRLVTAEDACDIDRFDRYVAEAARAARDGDPEDARRLLRTALSLWRGIPLAGVPGPHADSLRGALTERRLGAVETRIRLDLELGEHAESVPELALLVAEHPLREGLRALLMLALYRGGRQAEALAAYTDGRSVLAAELGVEPSTELSDLYERVLRADPSLAIDPSPATRAGDPLRAEAPHGSAADRTAGYRQPTPAQLPAPPSDFTGRTAAVEHLLAALDADSPQIIVSAMSGLGGVGKTALALHAGHRVRHRYPDGQLHVDLGGTSADPVEPEEVLGRFLRALGIGAVPDGLDKRAALYRSMLAGRRVLVLLDNAADGRQVTPLLPGTPGCAALVTSRVRLSLPSARAFELDVFSDDEALALLSRIVGPARIAAEPEAAAELVAACGRLPLAVRIVGARLAQRPVWTVAGLVDRLTEEQHRLGQIKIGDLAVDATFRLSYDQLPPDLARAFRLAALADGPVLSVPMAASLLDRDERQTEALLEQLVDVGLLEPSGERHYRYHDLLRLFARARAEEAVPDAKEAREPYTSEADAALDRLVDFCLATVRGAYRHSRPGCTTADSLAPTRATPVRFEDASAGKEWVRDELDTLLGVLRQAARRPGTQIAPAADLLLALDPFGENDFLWPYLNGPAAALADAAALRGEPAAEIRARYMLGGGLWQVGRGAEGRAQVDRALALCRATGDEVMLGQLLNVSALLDVTGTTGTPRYESALALLREAVAVHVRRGNLWGELEARNNTAHPLRQLGHLSQALDCLTNALSRATPLGWTVVRVYVQTGHARTLVELGRPAEAVASYTEALDGCRAIGSEHMELLVERGLGEALHELGRYGQAAAHLERSLAGARRLGNDPLQAAVLLALGTTLSAAGHAERADASLRAAHSLHIRLGIPLPEPLAAYGTAN
ncbi:BTAD domain-containing putative transcriptional regulator [Streptomyces sp. TLI_146]|uniref:AfsR/SARP family transcriptional regulator n=1 Tax=Streptomyces sp. TLI_146 TaxID=1938858 RepID=UPI000CADB381|nr:BTAD domain-containing putative transcriptional regulator [Streptomyces sp. TLI_146]PKV89702.1 DNA-binding SARP family transcriptional activator [Streptomyces sp. TLI_146]